MSTAPANIIRDALRLCLRTESVADAAGVGHDDWAAEPTDGGHVFDRKAGYVGARNRGRCPFLEFWLESGADNRQLSYDGGVCDSVAAIRCQVSGSSADDAEQAAREILAMAVLATRTLVADDFLVLGDESYDSLTASPMGYSLTVRATFQHAAGRDELPDMRVYVGAPGEYMFRAPNVSGLDLAAGSAVYAVPTGVDLADASDSSKRCVGLLVSAVDDGDVASVQTDGIQERADWSDVLESGDSVLVAGTRYFLSLVAGKLTDTAPASSGALVQLVGTAVTATKLDLEISAGVELA